MSSYLYMFKASGLQRYIFGTQPLREAIGASQLIIELTQRHLDDALQAADADDHVTDVQRAAGSAILEFDERPALERFYAVWPMMVSEIAPGLEIDQWAAERSDALFDDLHAGWEALRARRNLAPPPIPEVAPVVQRSKDSGQAAVAENPTGRDGVVDAASLRKLEITRRHDGSAAGVKPSDIHDEWRGRSWAVELQHIARGEDSYMAVVHADGNRIGGFLIEVAESIAESDLRDEDVASFYGDFADKLDEATKSAVVEALKLVEEPGGEWTSSPLPARPVVVGGDDVTLIVPAGRAVAITERFLTAFADRTAAMLEQLRSDYPRLEALESRSKFTACAGVVFQKQKYPLLQGYEHCEDLCTFAKKEGARGDGTTTAGLMFMRLLDSDRSDEQSRRARDFVEPQSGVRICAGPYTVDDGEGLITIDAIRRLAADLRDEKLATNSAREIIDWLHRDKTAASQAFERARYVGGEETESFARRLTEAHQSRTRHRDNLEPLSLLPDAAILAKMQSPQPTEAP